jgi:putative lipase involved disintegration of autophagic bodies
MAFQFYKAVADQVVGFANSNPLTANISLTGHSLGGGLAA